MGSYFEALDRFVHTAVSKGEDMDVVLRAFERSDLCPVFAEYVMWPRTTRLAVARNRFPYMSRLSLGAFSASTDGGSSVSRCDGSV